MNIGKFSVDNHVLVNILTVTLIVLGLFSVSRLPREMMSEVSFSWVFILVPYPGVSAEEIEKNITIPIENEISDVDKIKSINSSTVEGQCFVRVAFEDDISKGEFSRLYQDVRAEFDKVKLPEDALDPWIEEYSSSDMMPMITLLLSGDVDDAIINEAANDLQEKILDIKHVSKAQIVGGRQKEIWVEANRDKLEAFGISLYEISAAIKSRNLNIPGGTLKSETRDYILQTIGEMKKSGDFGNIIVRSRAGSDGGVIRVRDLATINSGLADANYDVRYNGNKAISIWISKTAKGNSIGIVNEVKREIEVFKKSLPKGISVDYFNDTTVQIRDILSTLTLNSILGFLSLIIVLLVFLGFRNSLITAMGIPITFSLTFIFMEVYGESLNGSSLFGLVMVLGMIVDHAIVIMENSYRYRQGGMSPREAAIKGTNEVVKPVIAGTLTTVAAFLPLMILPGIMGKFMRIIPIVVSLALVASTLEALFILPVHFADWGSTGKKKTKGFFIWMQGSFRRMISRLYKHKKLTFSGALLVIVLALMTTPMIKQDLFAGDDFTHFFINIELPIGTPRSRTNEVTAKFEEKILPLIGNGEVEGIISTVGFLMLDDEWLTQNHVSQLTVDITEIKDGRKRPLNAILKDIKKLCSDIPGAENIQYRKVALGPPVAKPIVFNVRGDNFDDLSSIAEEYKQLLREYPELTNIDDNFDKERPELHIVVDEERAAGFGLSAAAIGMAIRGSFEGVEATSYFDNDEEIDVIVKFAKEFKTSMEDIRQMKIPVPDGRMVPFSSVCKLVDGKGIAQIKRADKKREIMISADAEHKDNIRAINNRIQAVFNTRYQASYPNVTLKMGGEFDEFNEMINDLLRLFTVGVFLMYIILGAQFKSFVQPLIMFFTLPFAIVGCILFLALSGTPLSINVMFAAVALIGISVNDSIVLISYINSARRSGMDTMKAVIEGSVVRLRPIILTSVTTIGGLLPMAIGLGGQSNTWGPMASTMIFGLFFSTVGTLVVIPCVYGILDDTMKVLGFKMKLEGEQ